MIIAEQNLKIWTVKIKNPKSLANIFVTDASDG